MRVDLGPTRYSLLPIRPLAPLTRHQITPILHRQEQRREDVSAMTLTRQTMTDEQRKSVALEYLKAFDNDGVTSTGESIVELFAPDAQAMFPQWGLANGREEIGEVVGGVG